MIWNNTVRCTAENAREYYAQDASRVLSLFVFAAENHYAVDADTMRAAMKSAKKIGMLPGKTAGAAAQRMLLSPGPKALAMLMQAGAYAPFGLPQMRPDTKSMALLPENADVRWWLFLHRCGIQSEEYGNIIKNLALGVKTETLLTMDSLSLMKTPPQGTVQLKRIISRMPQTLSYPDAAAALATENPQWQNAQTLYAELCRTHEPFTESMLAVTREELLADRIPKKALGFVMRGLLDAVIVSPQLNFPQALMTLAHGIWQRM